MKVSESMSEITIKSNGHVRELKALYELPREIAESDFNYVGPCDESNDEAYSRRFFNYRGSWYDVNEFEGLAVGSELALRGWGACQGESYFSAVLIRYAVEWDGITVDCDAVVVGYAHW
jgi:hypothetical protein